MKHLPLLIWLALSSACGTVAQTRTLADDSLDAHELLERMADLAGEWTTVATEASVEADGRAEFKVTAGGTVVEQRLLVGTRDETLTVFHLDRAGLRLTHYGADGRQVRMLALPSSSTKHIYFEFVDGTNLNPKIDRHMHEAEFHFLDENNLHAVWTAREEDQVAQVVRYRLRRND